MNTATARRNQVLDSMAETGAITREEADRAKAEPLKVAACEGRIDASDAPYFADYRSKPTGRHHRRCRCRRTSAHLHDDRHGFAARRVCRPVKTSRGARQGPGQAFRAGNACRPRWWR